MCETLELKNIENLELLSKHYNANIHIIHVNNDTFKDCPIRVGDYVSIAAYYRLIAADILPKNLDRILYLDCDMIINGNIKELYDHDINEYAFGAVIDEAYFNNTIFYHNNTQNKKLIKERVKSYYMLKVIKKILKIEKITYSLAFQF